jgi:hypothetical protein
MERPQRRLAGELSQTVGEGLRLVLALAPAARGNLLLRLRRRGQRCLAQSRPCHSSVRHGVDRSVTEQIRDLSKWNESRTDSATGLTILRRALIRDGYLPLQPKAARLDSNEFVRSSLIIPDEPGNTHENRLLKMMVKFIHDLSIV